MSNVVALIARRELTTRLQQKGYRIGFGIALAIVVIGCILPSLFRGSGKPSSYDVAVATDIRGLPAALVAVGDADHVTVTVHRADPSVARENVDRNKWDAAVLPGGTVVAKHSGDTVVGIVQSANQLARTVAALQAAGLRAHQVSAALDVKPLTVHAATSGADSQKQAIAVIAVVVLFSQLVTFCTWVATGVVEEKASRVVELVLSSVRPMQLLAGKLLGIGLLAAGQVLVLGVVALGTATAAKTLTLPADGIVTLIVAFIGFVLGFAFFAALSAALASTVSRQEEVSGVVAPVSILLMVCYLASVAAANSPGGTFSRIVSIVPPFSCIAMPARLARGGVDVFDVALAVVLLVAAAGAITAVAARIYRATILHSGTRVSLRRAWRGEAVGDLA